MDEYFPDDERDQRIGQKNYNCHDTLDEAKENNMMLFVFSKILFSGFDSIFVAFLLLQLVGNSNQ